MVPNNRLIQAALAATRRLSPEEIRSLLEQQTIIVSAPRSGSHLLFELMAGVKGIWTIGRESHPIYGAFPHLYAENARLDSGCLGEAHADRDTRRLYRAIFLYLLRDKHGQPFLMLPASTRPPGAIKVLEKTPRNALNIPFLLKVFPKAKFIFLHREPRANVASLVEAWKVGLESGRFVTFRNLPGWDRPAWCFLLPSGWQSMIGKSLVEIAAFQWSASNNVILDQLAKMPPERWTAVSYRSLVGDPSGVLERLCRFVSPELRCNPIPIGTLPLSRTTLTPPHPEKWKKYEKDISALWPTLEKLNQRITALCEESSH